MNGPLQTHRRMYYYQIGGHRVGIDAADTFAINDLLPSFRPFAVAPHATDATGQLLFLLRIATEADKPCDPEACTHLTSFEWEQGQCTVLTLLPKGLCLRSPYSEQEGWMETTANRATAWLPAPPDAAAFVLNNFLMMLYAFTAASRDTVLVHASVVLQQGQAFLFLGTSGTGKSTHSALWLRHIRGSELMNDDNPILRIDPGTGITIAYGSPWSGKTPCYRPVQAPVAAIVRLVQAPRNHIAQQTVPYAFSMLLPSCSCLKQDEEIFRGVLHTVGTIVEQIPIFQLECLPDRAAAELCYRITAMQAGVYDDACLSHE